MEALGGLTQKEIAPHIGISYPGVAHLIRAAKGPLGENRPGKERFFLLAKLCQQQGAHLLNVATLLKIFAEAVPAVGHKGGRVSVLLKEKANGG